MRQGLASLKTQPIIFFDGLNYILTAGTEKKKKSGWPKCDNANKEE